MIIVTVITAKDFAAPRVGASWAGSFLYRKVCLATPITPQAQYEIEVLDIAPRKFRGDGHSYRFRAVPQLPIPNLTIKKFLNRRDSNLD